MTDEGVQDYLQQYISDKFKPNSRFMIKVPESSKDDALQEIYIDLWNNRHKYNPGIADYTTYAYNRGRHVIKNILVQGSRNGRIQERFRKLPCPQKHAPSGAEITEDSDTLDHIMSQLTEFQKEVVQLRFYEDKTVAEIAEIYQCSPQKIYQTLASLKKPQNNA